MHSTAYIASKPGVLVSSISVYTYIDLDIAWLRH